MEALDYKIRKICVPECELYACIIKDYIKTRMLFRQDGLQ